MPMEDFELNWRFDDEKYDKLPEKDLRLIKPLNPVVSKFLWDYISKSGLHSDIPFKKDYFETIEQITITADNKKDVKNWLYQCDLPLDNQVCLSWLPTTAIMIPWKLFIQYFDSFYYSVSDDLTIVDESLSCALFFHHSGEIYFGRTTNFTPI